MAEQRFGQDQGFRMGTAAPEPESRCLLSQPGGKEETSIYVSGGKDVGRISSLSSVLAELAP